MQDSMNSKHHSSFQRIANGTREHLFNFRPKF